MRFLVLGGGVAGVACVEELRRVCVGGDEVTLLSPSDKVVGVRNLTRASAHVERFDVVEVPLDSLASEAIAAGNEARPRGAASVRVLRGSALRVDAAARLVHALVASDGGGALAETALSYDRLCVCTGAAPRVLARHPLVLGVRDAESIAALGKRVCGARRVVVAGNGAIALGLVERLPSLLHPQSGELVWAVREGYVGATFFDASATSFLLAASEAPSDHNAPPSSSFASSFAPGTLQALSAAASRSSGTTATIAAALDRHRACDEAALNAIAHACHYVFPDGDGEGDDDVPSDAHCAAHAPDAAAGRDGTSVSSQQQLQPSFSSALGDSWISALRKLALPISEGAKTPMTISSGVGAPEAASSGVRVVLESCCEVVALRGTRGTSGAVGVLADGEWHDMSELQELQEQQPPLVESVLMEGDSAACVITGGEMMAWPLFVRLSSGVEYGCDVLLSPTGVCPVTHFLPYPSTTAIRPGEEGAPIPFLPRRGDFHRHTDGGLLVNPRMQTTGDARVYAAGDAAAVLWPRATPQSHGTPPLWFQMRLWTQARVAGAFAARSMAGALEDLEASDGGVAFELFAHATETCGHSVVLLGLYNGQGLGAAYERALSKRMLVHEDASGELTAGGESLTGSVEGGDEGSHLEGGGGGEHSVTVQMRVTPGDEYAKIVLLNGRVVGAMLIGSCVELGECLENLILNRLDMRCGHGDELMDLLDPDLELDDFFD